jgi:hypothetical protein
MGYIHFFVFIFLIGERGRGERKKGRESESKAAEQP